MRQCGDSLDLVAKAKYMEYETKIMTLKVCNNKESCRRFRDMSLQIGSNIRQSIEFNGFLNIFFKSRNVYLDNLFVSN